MVMTPKKILVVEDNPVNLRLIRMTLQPRGYSLLSATSGEEGLAVALSESPDLILLDIQLPGKSGLEVLRELKESPQMAGIPVIALTAYAMKGDRERFLEAGFDAYAEKPIDVREFPKLVDQMLSGR
jgi:CheY-like chemotaxis protein